MVLRLNALFIIYILPENTGPHCNGTVIGRGSGAPSSSPSGDVPKSGQLDWLETPIKSEVI